MGERNTNFNVKEIWCKESGKILNDANHLQKEINLFNRIVRKYHINVQFKNKSDRIKVENANSIDFRNILKRMNTIRNKT